MSSMNLKVRVKEGKLSPKMALTELLATGDDMAGNSNTARWLASPNAEKRYKQACQKNKS